MSNDNMDWGRQVVLAVRFIIEKNPKMTEEDAILEVAKDLKNRKELVGSMYYRWKDTVK